MKRKKRYVENVDSWECICLYVVPTSRCIFCFSERIMGLMLQQPTIVLANAELNAGGEFINRLFFCLFGTCVCLRQK